MINAISGFTWEPQWGGLVMWRETCSVPACGCSCDLGMRTDRMEPVVALRPCCDEHRTMLERVYAMLVASLDNPTDEPLAEVVDGMLMLAHENFSISEM